MDTGKRLLLAVGALSGAMGATFSAAQNAPSAVASDSGDSLQEVVVTAQRRSENQQKVPITINAVSGEALTDTGTNSVESLQSSVPGLNITMDTGNTKIFLRGVGTTAVATDNSVGLYIDGVYVAAQASSFLNLSNIAHVEVLKGPQGTLFGRNTTGGVVQIVTKDPSFSPEAEVTLGYGNYNTFTGNFYGSTGLTDTLAVDFSYYYSNQLDSPGENVTTGTKNIYRQNAEMIRNKWLWKPTDSTTVTLALDYGQDRQATGIVWNFYPGAVGIDGKTSNVGYWNTASDLDNHFTDRNYGAALHVEQDLGFARLVSITGFRDSLNIQTLDQDGTPVHAVDATPLPNLDETFSQELQLQSAQTDSKLQWIGGFYYMLDRFSSLPLNIGEGTDTVDVYVREPTRSYAEFGQATYEFLPDTHVTAGLRYTRDTKQIGGYDTFDGALAAPAFKQTNDFTRVTYRAILDHQFTPDVLGYVSFNTGFKSGQYSLVNFTLPPVRPENLTAYETGFKSELMDHKLRVNASAFYYKYKDIQVQEVVVGGTQLENAAAATLYGLDLDFTARLTHELSLQGSAEYLHGRYSSFANDPSYVPALTPGGLPAGGNALISINGTGFSTVNSPAFTGYLAVDYTRELYHGTFDINVNESYNSGFYWNPDNRLRQPSFALLGAYAKWSTLDSKWEYRVFGNNITSKHYSLYGDAFALGDIYSPAPPAMYGFAVTRRFGK